jgi:hypothetical protein
LGKNLHPLRSGLKGRRTGDAITAATVVPAYYDALQRAYNTLKAVMIPYQ